MRAFAFPLLVTRRSDQYPAAGSFLLTRLFSIKYQSWLWFVSCLHMQYALLCHTVFVSCSQFAKHRIVVPLLLIGVAIPRNTPLLVRWPDQFEIQNLHLYLLDDRISFKFKFNTAPLVLWLLIECDGDQSIVGVLLSRGLTRTCLSPLIDCSSQSAKRPPLWLSIEWIQQLQTPGKMLSSGVLIAGRMSSHRITIDRGALLLY